MATAGECDGRAPYESRGDGEKSRKKRLRPEIEDPHNVSQEAEQNNSDQVGNYASISVTFGVGKSELEQMLKQMTFTRSEVQRLTALLHSRICDDADATICLPITPMTLPQQPTTIENLSGDLLSKIFILLMAKQLAQMRCVSKSWNALLSHPSFIKSHLHHSINNNDRILLVFYEKTSSSDHEKFVAYPCRPPYLELSNFIKLPLPPVNPKSGDNSSFTDIIGSVHGLICSRYTDDVIHIWNPSLSAVSTLPPYSCSLGDDVSFGFGYDGNTDDYKVVKISGVFGPHTIRPGFSILVVKEWLQAEIYSMRKGCWKFITQRIPSHVAMIFEHNYVCVDGHDGHLHWSGYIVEEGEPQPRTIVVFDLGSETLFEMPLPDAILEDNRMNHLGVLSGKLCVRSYRWFEDEGIDVWVMEEYGVAESWVKRHSFCFSHFNCCPLNGFTSHSEFIYRNTDGHLVLYDPVADKTRILEKHCRGKYRPKRIVEYIDSLVWVAPSLP
ncbi:F-box/kelch-repeat protein At3g06240 isoform X2 [Lactuca sativa]|uniref:F-box/kelch-repeat protein At3g06240 isoform X2 n=1 Tax=Lactuca sativa TaxID=4236 RepID=UPI000CD90344|nr:F-box/kelch-repeat protein At3g06240 isoform X2 [Lactuca sativa]